MVSAFCCFGVVRLERDEEARREMGTLFKEGRESFELLPETFPTTDFLIFPL